MTRMTGPDCAVMCNLINIHTYIHNIHTYIRRSKPHGLLGIFRVIVCFGVRGKEDILGRWVHLWIQQS